jgi:hypothetical protein
MKAEDKLMHMASVIVLGQVGLKDLCGGIRCETRDSCEVFQ